jgi:hypothetical protein
MSNAANYSDRSEATRSSIDDAGRALDSASKALNTSMVAEHDAEVFWIAVASVSALGVLAIGLAYWNDKQSGLNAIQVSDSVSLPDHYYRYYGEPLGIPGEVVEEGRSWLPGRAWDGNGPYSKFLRSATPEMLVEDLAGLGSELISMSMFPQTGAIRSHVKGVGNAIERVGDALPSAVRRSRESR